LIVRNLFGEDIFSCGPRPDEARLLRQRLTEHGSDTDRVKITLQKWYNVDQGRTLQKELTERLQEYVMK
ncbi:MAG: thioredoxin family protein, partial [Bacteroidota bacterium]